MSWVAIVTGIEAGKLEDALVEKFNANYPEPDAGVTDQFDAALAAMYELREAVGEYDTYNVSLNGHVDQRDGNSAKGQIMVSLGGM